MEDDKTSLMAARALRPGYEILWYTIEKVLGQGGFGITYLAHDRNLDRSVAIKEYLPTPFAYRHKDFSVKPLTGEHRDHFTWGLDSFQREARTLAKFGHDNIVRVHSVFEQNNTAYMVMEYEDGENLASVYENRKHALDQDFFQQIFFPIFDGLKEIHKFGFIHRDIKPANIYIRDNRTPVLIDFGSARETAGQQAGEMTTLITQGYTPLEQYSSNYGEQGPWTDIYALAATIYEGVVGEKPEESLSRSACILRSKPDLIQPLSARDYPGYTQTFLDALIFGLALEPEKRPADLNRWLSEFYASETTAPAAAPASVRRAAVADDDRTRLQPRARKPGGNGNQDTLADVLDFPAGSEPRARPAPQPRPESLTVVLAKAHKPAAPERTGTSEDDQFDISIENLDFLDDSGIRPAEPGIDEAFRTAIDNDTDFPPAVNEAGQADEQHQDRKRGSRLGRTVGALAVSLAVAVAGFGAYQYFDGTTGRSAQPIDSAMLRELPVPAQALEIVLPRDIVLQQLGAIQVMTALYKQAAAIDPDNAELNRSIDASFDKLLQIATRWNASSHPQVAEKLAQVANLMPRREQQVWLFNLLENSDARSDSSELKRQLSSGTLASGDGTSVLELVSGLSADDLGAISQSDEWRSLLLQYRQSAVEKIKTSDFASAARLVTAGLSLEPDDAQLALLRDHLGRL